MATAAKNETKSDAKKPAAPSLPAGMTEVNPFGESGDGWYQYPEQADAASAAPIDGVFLGTVMVAPKNSEYGKEPKAVHKFRLTNPVPDCLGAKGTDHEGKIINLEKGQIMLMWGKADINQKLAAEGGKEGGLVALRSIGMKKLGGGKTMWEWLVGCDKSTLPSLEERAQIRANNKARGKKTEDMVPEGAAQRDESDIPF